MDLDAAVQRWTHQLADTSGRNPLLFFNSTRRGLVELVGGTTNKLNQPAVSRLLQGDAVRTGDIADSDSLVDLNARCRLVGRQAQTSFEERGIRTLFVVHGLVSWEPQKNKPKVSAPVLLQAATMSPVGSGTDWEVVISHENWEVNPLLLQTLESEHGIYTGNLQHVAADSTPFEETQKEVFEALQKRCGELPEFTIKKYSYLANFSYEKLALVNDIKSAFQSGVMAQNDVLLALAGDTDAVTRLNDAVQSDLAVPDLVSPSDEYLVLDADSSQSEAINAVVNGANLVIEGPPGTGKSQTIANLIASLAARGKKVLFVAEKRAAIEAVTRRLNIVGLGDIVLDLHDGGQSRRHMYQQIDQTLTNNTRVARPETKTNDMSLLQHRQTLIDYTLSLHERREPWGVSVFSCQDVLTGATVMSPVRFRSETLFMLNAEAVKQVRDQIRRFVTLGGPELEGVSDDPWQAVYLSGAIVDGDDAAAALEAIQAFRHDRFGVLLSQLRQAASETGLPPAGSLQGWSAHFAIWDRTAQMLNICKEGVFREDPEHLAEIVDTYRRPPAGKLLASLTSDTYRHARDKINSFLSDNNISRDDACDTIEKAILLLQDWRLMSNNKSTPCLPHRSPVNELENLFRSIYHEARSLERWLGGERWEVLPTPELLATLDNLIGRASSLYRIPELVGVRTRLGEYGLNEFVAEVAEQNLTGEQAVELFDVVWHASILDRVAFSDPTIGTFSGEEHRRIVDEFREVDREHIRLGAAKVRRLVAERSHLLMESQPKEGNLMRQQARMKRGHMPARKFFVRAGELAAAIKPCWATSPLMVSQMLPQRTMFDVVIFDEASQIRPAEAISAILRAKQVVVAGDSKQLPPTSFFATRTTTQEQTQNFSFWEDEPETDDITYDESGSDAMIMESILDAMAATFPAATTTLTWHYRSLDEKLILFSNAQPELYDWSLVTFPGARTTPCLQHHLVDAPQQHDDGTVTVPEVQHVVTLVVDHAASRPHESLGVIAFGTRHAELIQEALFVEQQKNDEFAEWVTSGTPAKNGESLFVKNLERVQGDERDRVILSVGYGKRPDGKMMYRFGPLNMEGGERRLNVAVTRARRHMDVVSSFTAKDMDPDKLRAAGAQMLQRYLAYTESQGTDLGVLTYAKPQLSVFERDVLRHLTARGLPVVPHYGSSGQWLSFAVAHPSDHERMVLAIESDDARYRAMLTVRDRDRLRQEHLERLGWSFYRLWSTDWQRNAEKETERIVETWRAAALKSDHIAEQGLLPKPDDTPAASVAQLPPKRLPFPLRDFRSGAPIGSYTKMELVDLMRWVESDGLLRTENDLINESMLVLGYKRRGPTIIKSLHDAARTARYRIPI